VPEGFVIGPQGSAPSSSHHTAHRLRTLPRRRRARRHPGSAGNKSRSEPTEQLRALTGSPAEFVARQYVSQQRGASAGKMEVEANWSISAVTKVRTLRSGRDRRLDRAGRSESTRRGDRRPGA